MSQQLDHPEEGMVRAAYALAFRVTGSESAAVASVEAAAHSVAAGPAPFLRSVREEARRLRTGAGAGTPIPRPAALASVDQADWAVLERVALRGMRLTEASQSAGVSRPEALLQLNRGLHAARRALVAHGQACDDSDATWLERLRGDLAAGGRHDPACDRQPEPRAAALLSR